jgi:hypothetical protein
MNPIQARTRLRAQRRWIAPAIVVALILQSIPRWTDTAFAVMLSTISGLAVWSGMADLVHHVRLRSR